MVLYLTLLLLLLLPKKEDHEHPRSEDLSLSAAPFTPWFFSLLRVDELIFTVPKNTPEEKGGAWCVLSLLSTSATYYIFLPEPFLF